MNAEPCITGFREALHDASMLESDVQQQSAVPGSDKGDYCDPCPEDEELFNSGQDAKVMEEAISKFMYGMEAQERGGFKDLH